MCYATVSLRITSLFILLLAALAAQAQDSATSQAKTTPYAMPELPAIYFIGGQANTVTRPVTPRALATEVVNGVDSSGHVKQGLAVAVTPFSLLGGSVTLRQYQGAWWRAALYNAQVSAGSARVAASDGATDLGTGLRLTLYDRSDPMRDTAYTAHIRRLLGRALPDDPSNSTPAFSNAQQAIIDYRQQWRKANWNRSALAVAAASGWQLTAARLVPNSANQWLGWSAWATQAVRVAHAGQLLGQVRYSNQQRIEAADGSFHTNNQLDYSARAVFGSAIVNFSAEITGVSRSSPLPGAARAGVEWAAGLEFRATDAIWLATSVGKKLSVDARPAAASVFAGLRWAINTDARLQVP